MSCPKCGSEKISNAGFYVTKLYKKRNRFKCKECGRHFIAVPKINGLTLKQQNEIIRLSKRINPYISKYDNRKERTYSIREIERIMGISENAIAKVLKNAKKRK